MKWNPHSLTLITPNPTPSLTTQLTLVYNTYVYPQREEEKDSRMAGFKLGVFYREAHLIGPQESCCSTIGRTQKAVWILAHSLRTSYASKLRSIVVRTRKAGTNVWPLQVPATTQQHQLQQSPRRGASGGGSYWPKTGEHLKKLIKWLTRATLVVNNGVLC